MKGANTTEQKTVNNDVESCIDYAFLLDSLMNNIDDYVWFIDRDYSFIAFNQNLFEFFLRKYSVRIKAGDNFLSFLNEEERKYWKNICEQAFLGNHIFDKNKRFIDEITLNDGNLSDTSNSFNKSSKFENSYYKIFINPVKNSLNEIIGLSIYAKNISDSKLAEEKILKSELLSQSILSTSPDGIVTTELDGTITFASDKFIEMVGNILLDELFSKKINDFVYEKDLENFNENFENISQGKHLNSYTFRLLKKDGTFFYVESKIDVIRNEENRPIQILFILRDITDRITAEIEKEKLLQDIAYSRDQIEQEAAKYVELNNQLYESEKKLQELNAAKDKLFSIIGHDMKNPIITLLGFSEILAEDYDELSDDEKKEYIKTIYETTLNTKKLLENLLNWSRAQSGRMQINLEAISLKTIIKESIELVKSQAEKKNITLNVDMNSSLMVYADKNLLETIIRNLLTNAIKFTGDGGKVSLNTVDENGYVKISVKDTGIGLSKDDVQKLFRIDVNNKEIGNSKEKGTGLGLILCKEFCEKLGGKIWVESELGKGSKFFFTVPIYNTTK